MKRYVKIFYIVAAVLSGIFFVILVAAIFKYNRINPEDKSEKIQFKIAEPAEPKLCEAIKFTAQVDCDWKTSPERLEFTLPEGLQIISDHKFRILKILWGKIRWQMEIDLQAYRPGNYEGIKGRVIFSRKNLSNTETEFYSNPFNVSEIPGLDQNAAPQIAGKIQRKVKLPAIILFLLILLILLAFILFAIFAKRKRNLNKHVLIPPWQKALDKLNELRLSQKKNLIAAELCAVKLCDIIRDYLEERFNIHAPKMTSLEFLTTLKKTSGILNDEHKKFLNQFMEASDMIKFANIPADMEMIDRAIVKAEELVKETLPAEEEKKK